jgi:aldose 1-epimerase
MPDNVARFTLGRGDVELILVPGRGGGIAAFRWRGIDIFRPDTGGGFPQDLACFPLVPFSNRIASGQFMADGNRVRLAPNLPGVVQPHAIHGFGWQSKWHAVEQGQDRGVLTHVYEAQAWPWSYCANQFFELDDMGFSCRLSLRNDGDTAMPAGLGLHPYFPRAGAVLDLPVTGRWESDNSCLPIGWCALAAQPDWLGGAVIDHVFTGRTAPITIDWPGRRLTISPADDLDFTVVYAPDGEEYFCVEPVSHMTDAVNRSEMAQVTGLRWLAPGETWQTSIRFAVEAAG